MIKIGHQSNVCPKKKFKKKFAHVGIGIHIVLSGWLMIKYSSFHLYSTSIGFVLNI